MEFTPSISQQKSDESLLGSPVVPTLNRVGWFAGSGYCWGGQGLTGNDAYGNLVLTTGENARLAALDDNGGATKTHALLEESQAIDHESTDYANEFEFDQRRQSWFRDGDVDGLVVVDIGAYEVDADEFFETLGA